MPNAFPQNIDDPLRPEQTLILKYEGEDDQSVLVSGTDGVCLTARKNRSVPKPFRDQPPQPLTPAFHLLVLAFIGLAPAGLGTLVLAPLAAIWALVVLFTRPLPPADQKRVIIVWGIAAVLLGIAVPMSKLFLARFP